MEGKNPRYPLGPEKGPGGSVEARGNGQGSSIQQNLAHVRGEAAQAARVLARWILRRP